MLRLLSVCVLLLFLTPAARAAPRRVKTVDELRRAAASARPGTRIEILPGDYRGGLHLDGLAGSKGHPIVIAAADPEQPPVFRGGTSGVHLTDPAWVTLSHLVLERATGNGLNIDDGGSFDTPAHDVTLSHLVVRDVGPGGNRDGIKLSGVKSFLVADCTIERWGDGGSGIDMVGCHDGRIRRCVLRNGDTRGSNGIQAKGGTTDVFIDQCRFEHAGRRALQLGGSTGRPYFRPPLRNEDNVEARNVDAAGCTFIGSEAAVAWVSSIDCGVWNCTIYRPTRWILRVLQESTGPEFVPCRPETFAHNIIVWRASELRTHVNIGPGTEPGACAFEGNWYFAEDAPSRSRPAYPEQEKNPRYGKDPELVDPANGNLTKRPGSPATGRGADSYEPRD